MFFFRATILQSLKIFGIFILLQILSCSFILSTNCIDASSNWAPKSKEYENKVIVIVNGQPMGNPLTDSLRRRGCFLINLITPNLKIDDQAKEKYESCYDNVIVHNNISETIKSLKLLLQTKECTFGGIFSTSQNDIALTDIIRESLQQPYNGEEFRNFSHDKAFSVSHLNKTLKTQVEHQVVRIENFTKAISKQTLPCSIKVMSSNQILANYIIYQPSDINKISEKLKKYKTNDTKLWLQPYYANLYRLQVTSFNNKIIPMALWHERAYINDGEVQDSIRTLINLKESPIISEEKLKQISQQLVKAIHVGHGLCNFMIAFHKNSIEIVDYNLELPNHHEMEVMEEILGYNPLSYHLTHSTFEEMIPLSKKEFKNIVAVTIRLNTKNDLLQISMLPTFYRYYSTNGNVDESPIIGELYLVHPDKSLVETSCAAIKNTEHLLKDPLFLSHSAAHIVNFYSEAAKNKHSNYTLSIDKKSEPNETKEVLESLRHDSQHVTKYVKPIGTKASIQDIMRYYIDIYDLYILHGKPPGTKIIPMNTGNPSFLPFSPITNSIRKSLEENLESYSRYSMQVPEGDFIKNLIQYCKEEQILSPDQKLQPNNVIIGNGSTNLYYLALKSIIKNKGDIVLVTRPTYGLFIDPIYTAGGEVGFIDIEEKDDWKVQPEKLHKTIHFYNEKAFNNYILITFVKEYEKFLHALKVFNIDQRPIPSMPHIDGRVDLAIFDKYIEKLNEFIDNISAPMMNKDELRFSFSPRVKAFYHMNPHNPTGAVYTKQDLKEIAEMIQDHPGIYVIDDLAHWGVLYTNIQPATFAMIEGMFEKTLTLISLSKSYCVPGLRTGVAIGSSEIISEMQYRLLNSNSSASLPAMIALDAVLSTPKKERDDYLTKNSLEYLFRRDLMNVLINGIQKTDLTDSQKIKIYLAVLENEYKQGKPFDKKLLNIILSGIPLIRTLTQPQGCFFHLVDISKLIGAKIGDNPPFQTATDVRNAIYSVCNINTVPGEISGNFFNYSLRMSFSLPPQQIYNACKSINLFIGKYIIKQNPSILEKNYSSLESKNKNITDEQTFKAALLKFYLDKTIETFRENQTNISPDKSSAIEKKILTLKQFSNKIIEAYSDKIFLKKITDYLEENQSSLKSFPNIEELNNCLKQILEGC